MRRDRQQYDPFFPKIETKWARLVARVWRVIYTIMSIFTYLVMAYSTVYSVYYAFIQYNLTKLIIGMVTAIFASYINRLNPKGE
jgi:uncharacterized membrane protein